MILDSYTDPIQHRPGTTLQQAFAFEMRGPCKWHLDMGAEPMKVQKYALAKAKLSLSPAQAGTLERMVLERRAFRLLVRVDESFGWAGEYKNCGYVGYRKLEMLNKYIRALLGGGA